VLARQDGPAIVAGHSYGGQIITALGTDAPNIVGLVYIAGFGLDEGESIGALLAQGPPTSDCAQACTADADADLSEQNLAEMVTCIRLCPDRPFPAVSIGPRSPMLSVPTSTLEDGPPAAGVS
jgi:pimeloyl-ACP methyl ester carboxylesterase